MDQRYAALVYLLIVGHLCLGELLSPFFPMFLPLNRHLVRTPVQFSNPHLLQRQGAKIRACNLPLETSIDPRSDIELSQELMAVFGDDSLWQRAQLTQTSQKLGKITKQHSHKHLSMPNPVSASWSTISSWLPFNNDLDLGSNSNTDIYVQFLAKKQWNLHSGLDLDTAQIFRYGSTSKNYAETNFNLTQKFQQQALFSTQFNLSKTQDEDYTWRNRTFQKLHLLSKDNLSYGIISEGDYENKELRVNQWGPYFSWKRPIWRNWLYMQNDLNYLNIPADKQDNHFSYQMSFEAHF
ncbi:selenocysteine synthase [Acinetobacter gyllenbergii]|uniref:selenocysteine synthase n=1 Tax=Acinetobacter TaxID=469 RepID=UPI000806AEA0|nr:selenocysteine synthase [Acinetobacter gyllenbergii]MCU4580692.1 selenocysteine synthase [Acinetobacter gyllenbergii]OBY73367.1 selenocysteine synthase [Acinetobacter gyllenbergii]